MFLEQHWGADWASEDKFFASPYGKGILTCYAGTGAEEKVEN